MKWSHNRLLYLIKTINKAQQNCVKTHGKLEMVICPTEFLKLIKIKNKKFHGNMAYHTAK